MSENINKYLVTDENGNDLAGEQPMPKEIWLLEDKETPEDHEMRVIWSPDADCEDIHEGYKIQAKYYLASDIDALLDMCEEALLGNQRRLRQSLESIQTFHKRAPEHISLWDRKFIETVQNTITKSGQALAQLKQRREG